MDRVVVEPIDKDKFRVYKDFIYQGIYIPKGFVTNGANIPRVFWSIFPPNSPEYISAVVIHDYLCDEAKSKADYKYADKMLYEAMISLEVAKWKCKVFYLACRAYHRVRYMGLR
ncbi:putative protein (DUF1353 domain) [Campylobacter hyointestinalis subsp. lawsonii CCUG 27631]|uniref:DUF1353 domain-containing protein n=1 Tax=Campylobacter hyointestinalis TaxID=198 RepID=UPI0007C8F334|nr:DUF1353 domain-containing protein [Campylobacter hyointestinalis]ANE34350.1 putative protein (DUF1353 domain) [Campylobacter hyointestinalis subsp. lawsonii CCUG 27631]